MPVLYNGKSLVPTVTVGIDKTYNRSEGGDKLCPAYTITLSSSLCSERGNPAKTSSGVFFFTGPVSGIPDTPSHTIDDKLDILLQKQEAVRDLFSDEGGLLEIYGWDGSSPPTKARISRVESISFTPGDWINRTDYQIVLSTDKLLGPLINPSGEDLELSPCVNSANESWDLRLNEEGEVSEAQINNTYTLSHQIAARGQNTYDDGVLKPGWHHARDFVQARAGIDIDRMIESGAFDIPSYYNSFNHVRSTSLDELAGNYSLNETWIISSGDCLENFTVETTDSIDQPFSQVTIQGEVRGLETRGTAPSGSQPYSQVTKQKYEAASGCFASVKNNLLQRAQTYSDKKLNPLPVSKTIGYNPIGGVVNYSYGYDSRPSSCLGTKSETITVVDNNKTDIFASHLIICGGSPVHQDLNAQTASTRNIRIEAIADGASGCSSTALLVTNRPDSDSLIATLKPSSSSIFKTEDTETWSPSNGSYSRSVTWEYL